LNVTATVSKSESREWSTPTLAAGSYSCTLSGSGDADLYVRIGSPPTLSRYDCRPSKSGSNESCQIPLDQPAAIYVMVRGYAPSSTVTLVGKRN
jgi:leucyl aminopeptidase